MRQPCVHRALAAILALLAGGCATLRHASVPVAVPVENHFTSPTPGEQLRRVALLPMHSETYPDQNLRALDAAFLSELSKRGLFEVVPVSRGELEAMFGARQFSSTDTLPADALTRLRDHCGVDGVLFTDLTHFSPYRPVSMGVRTKLVAAGTGQIRWAFDYVFDAGNAGVAEAAKRFQITSSNEHQPLTTDGGSILLSPTRFAKYVANETYASLRQE
jgi:hypothetical protein